MDGGPDPKRPRLSGPQARWENAPDSTRNLPPLPQNPNHPYQSHSPNPFPPHLDRHHTEPHPQPHPLYEHRQDHRRPSSGPSYAYPPTPHPPPPPQPYPGSRDPPMKRDPSDDSPQPQQHYRRSPTNNAPEHNVNTMPHNEPARPHYDPTRPDAPLPPSYNPSPSPYVPTPSPMHAPQEVYNSYPNNGLPTPRDFSSVTYPSVASAQRGGHEQVRKKAQRAAQACDSCRNLKAKCDEGRPSCTTCKEKGFECRYRDPPPKQQDKQTADIMESMQRLEALIKGRFDSVEADIREIKKVQASHALNGIRVEPDLKQEAEEKFNAVSAYPGPSIATEPQSTRSPYSSTPALARISEPERVNIVEQAHDLERPQKSEDEDDEDAAGGGLPEARDSTMPINHTTGAAQLLLVSPIREMCKEIMKSALIKNENYPMRIEQRRGQLRLYGRGEGHDLAPGYDRRNNSDQSAGTPDDEFSNVSSPGDGGDAYGGSGGFTPPASGEGIPRVERGVIDALGMPDLSRDTVIKLIELYKEKMSIMHPIISNKHLDRLVETFLKSIPEDKAKSKQLTTVRTNAGFVGPAAGPPESPGTKRKRSSGNEFPDIQNFIEHKPGHPNRSMTSCIVLLCMALGKICDYNHKLPDYAVANEKDALYSMSPVMRNGYPPSPLNQSSPAISTPNAMGSPPDMERTHSRSRRTSIEGAYMPRGGLSGKPRNIDIVPGLAYFALASDILGNQLGGNDLPHVHAHILAALYHGQLGRVVESHGYLANACRAIQVLLDGRISTFKKTVEFNATAPAQLIKEIPQKYNALVFAFWTCLQLESDIVAEMSLPRSGILTYEDFMPGPNIKAAQLHDGIDRVVTESYSAQLSLRKHLNVLHTQFYKRGNDILDLSDARLARLVFTNIANAEANLEGIIALNKSWDVDPAELARDMLGARFRAKCYGAQVITYRPFVLKILDGLVDSNGHCKLPLCLEEFYPYVMGYARKGIRALIDSTRAFHGLGDPSRQRLIVTNIWGTAHAQWGNMMVLQAAYMHPILRPMVLEVITLDNFKTLLTTTLAFINLHATKSSALHADWKILDATSQKNGLKSSCLPSNASSSFSSNNGDYPMSGR